MCVSGGSWTLPSGRVPWNIHNTLSSSLPVSLSLFQIRLESDWAHWPPCAQLRGQRGEVSLPICRSGVPRSRLCQDPREVAGGAGAASSASVWAQGGSCAHASFANRELVLDVITLITLCIMAAVLSRLLSPLPLPLCLLLQPSPEVGATAEALPKHRKATSTELMVNPVIRGFFSIRLQIPLGFRNAPFSWNMSHKGFGWDIRPGKRLHGLSLTQLSQREPSYIFPARTVGGRV